MASDPVARFVDPAFLSANRDGRLASRQETRLGDGAYRSRYERVVGFVAALAVAIAAAWTASSQGTGAAERATLWVVCAAIPVLAAIVFRPWADPLGEDLRAGRVERVTGLPVGRAQAASVTTGALRASYDVTIGGERFPVPAWLWSAVDEAREITAYYLPRSRTLVSIEVAADDLADRVATGPSPFLPAGSRRAPVNARRPMATWYFGGVGLALLVRAWLPPVELVPEIPAGLLFLAIAGATFVTGNRRR